MARYDYRCTGCGNVFEVEHPMSEHPAITCPDSVTFGDSSPGGRAKGLHMLARKMERICTDTLHSLFYDHPLKRQPPVFHYSTSRQACCKAASCCRYMSACA